MGYRQVCKKLKHVSLLVQVRLALSPLQKKTSSFWYKNQNIFQQVHEYPTEWWHTKNQSSDMINYCGVARARLPNVVGPLSSNPIFLNLLSLYGDNIVLLKHT